MRRRDLERLERLSSAIRVEAEARLQRLVEAAARHRATARTLLDTAAATLPQASSGPDLAVADRWRGSLRDRARAAEDTARALAPDIDAARAALSEAIARQEAAEALSSQSREATRRARAATEDAAACHSTRRRRV